MYMYLALNPHRIIENYTREGGQKFFGRKYGGVNFENE